MTKEKHKCESELSCKASASLNESVKADLQSEDKPLEELLNEENNYKTLSMTAAKQSETSSDLILNKKIAVFTTVKTCFRT